MKNQRPGFPTALGAGARRQRFVPRVPVNTSRRLNEALNKSFLDF